MGRIDVRKDRKRRGEQLLGPQGIGQAGSDKLTSHQDRLIRQQLSRCLVPQPCYWERKQAMPPAEWARAEAACRPLRALLSLGSLKGSEGLWPF